MKLKLLSLSLLAITFLIACEKKDEADKVDNGLISINKSLLINIAYETADYFVTDLDGNILNKAAFSKSEISGIKGNRVTIYSKGEYTGKKINLIRVSRGSIIPTSIEYFVGLEPGEYLNYKNPAGNYKYLNDNRNPPTSITVKNAIDYDHLIVSTDVSNFSLPVWPGSTYGLSYSSQSKALIQIENNNIGRYNFFDIPQGSTKLELDAKLVKQLSLVKTIKFPSAIEKGNIYAYGNPYQGFNENYALANKQFSGSSVNIFYPDTLINTIKGTVSYSMKGINYTHFYYESLPDNIEFPDFKVNIKTAGISNFDADISGSFGYYRVLYQNTGQPSENQVDLIVYAPKGQGKFKFPDISKDVYIPGYDLTSFRPLLLQMYKFDGLSTMTNHFNYISNVITPPGTSYYIMGSVDMKAY